MLGIVDVHCHVLPKMDDGSSSMEETMHMIKTAYHDGVRTIVATPHYHPGRGYDKQDYLMKGLQEVQELIATNYTDLCIYVGNEVFYHDSIVENLNNKQCLTINGTDYVLVEFHPSHSFEHIYKGVTRILQGGYIPIIAHVERYIPLQKNITYVRKLLEIGCLIQLNAGSVVGEVNYKTKWFCKKLLKKGWVHFVATDAHKQTGSRTMKFDKCAKYIEKKFGSEYATQLLITNPQMMLLGMDI